MPGGPRFAAPAWLRSAALGWLQLALLGATLAAASGCRALEAHTLNLRELHDEEGGHVRTAALVGDAEYVVKYGFASLFRRGEVPPGTKKRVDDPLGTCVENLLDLARIPADREGFEALKVEYFARYARLDKWQISRQISLEQLGYAGERLDLGNHPDTRPPPPADAAFATADELRAALKPMLDASNPRRGIGEDVDSAAACRTVAHLHYDDDGILRALATSAALLNRENASSPHHAALLALVLDLERRTVRLALKRGLDDPSPHVRAAAVTAGVRAVGPAFLSDVLPRLGIDVEPEMPLAILHAVRRTGLPPERPDAKPGQTVRDGALALLYRVATEHPEERVRVGAMRALGAVSGAGFKSLREEDWQSWWRARLTAAQP